MIQIIDLCKLLALQLQEGGRMQRVEASLLDGAG